MEIFYIDGIGCYRMAIEKSEGFLLIPYNVSKKVLYFDTLYERVDAVDIKNSVYHHYYYGF